jgi:hypothetical protein
MSESTRFTVSSSVYTRQQPYDAARPISDRTGNVLERLLKTEIEEAKRKIREAGAEKKSALIRQIEAEHEPVDVVGYRREAERLVDDFLRAYRDLRNRALREQVSLSIGVLDEALEAREDDEDNSHNLEVYIGDHSLQQKFAQANTQVDSEVRAALSELDEKMAEAQKHILVASLTPEEQRVLESVPQVDNLLQRLKSLGA